MKLKKYIQKLCCFYASDWHLTVMLLPYISKKINEDSSIYMKCENDIKQKLEILLNKLSVKNEKGIMSMSWNNTVNEDETDSKEKIYIISGSEEFIENKNQEIEEYYQNKDENIKIINCYEVNENCRLKDIIEENGYTKILNTKGEEFIEKWYKII